MIEYLELNNFQKHKQFLLELDEKVTTLVGPNEAGKTCLFRALMWIALNEPKGEDFTRHGEKQVRGLLGVDGRTVERSKGKGGNLYRLDGEPLRAVGTTVPEAVRGLVNLTEDNFQTQFEAPFWFMQSAPEVSRQLNKVVNLQIIDTTLANLAGELKKTQAEIRVGEDRLSSSKRVAKELAWTKRCDRDLKELEGIQEEKDRIWRKVNDLEDLIWRYDEFQKVIRKERAFLSEVDRILEDFQELSEAQQELTDLTSLIDDWEQNEQQLWQLKSAMRKLEKDARREFGKNCPLCGSELPENTTLLGS